MARRTVLLAFTQIPGHSIQLVRVYAQGSYQSAYNWLANIAEESNGNAAHPAGLPYPVAGQGNVTVEVIGRHGQRWWLERHDVI